MQNNDAHVAKPFSSPSLSSPFLGIIILISSLILTACAALQPTSTPAPAPAVIVDTPSPTTAPPTMLAKDLSQVRPYTDNSIWNSPIGSAPQYDPHSDEMVATIGLDSYGQITSNPLSYSYTLYFVDDSTPRWESPALATSVRFIRRIRAVEPSCCKVCQSYPTPCPPLALTVK